MLTSIYLVTVCIKLNFNQNLCKKGLTPFVNHKTLDSCLKQDSKVKNYKPEAKVLLPKNGPFKNAVAIFETN